MRWSLLILNAEGLGVLFPRPAAMSRVLARE